MGRWWWDGGGGWWWGSGGGPGVPTALRGSPVSPAPPAGAVWGAGGAVAPSQPPQEVFPTSKARGTPDGPQAVWSWSRVGPAEGRLRCQRETLRKNVGKGVVFVVLLQVWSFIFGSGCTFF